MTRKVHIPKPNPEGYGVNYAANYVPHADYNYGEDYTPKGPGKKGGYYNNLDGFAGDVIREAFEDRAKKRKIEALSEFANFNDKDGSELRKELETFTDEDGQNMSNEEIDKIVKLHLEKLKVCDWLINDLNNGGTKWEAITQDCIDGLYWKLEAKYPDGIPEDAEPLEEEQLIQSLFALQSKIKQKK